MGDQYGKEQRRLKLQLDDAHERGDFGDQRSAREHAKKVKRALKDAKKAEREPQRKAA